MRTALKTGKISNPKVASLIGIYTLAKDLNISPVEAYNLPASFIKDLLTVHGEMEMFKAHEIQRATNKGESQLNKIKI